MTPEEFFDRFHISLTDQQKAAVEAVEGPVLLLAVPGSGKTTVLVTRLGYMIYVAGIAPERILTLTYTVAATRDMKSRFAALFGDALAERLEFRTINGICAKIIGRFCQEVGKRSFDLISEEKKANAMLGAIYRQVTGEYATESDLADLRTLITMAKNQLLKEEALKKLGDEAGFDFQAIFAAYQKTLRQNSLMDYDDQLIYALNILRKSPRTLKAFQEACPYISVDEAQDTSKIQHTIIALLAGKRDNLFMVGDEDQSIYGFRAACPEALLRFEADHPKARVLLMETNFRSNEHIVKAADHFISKNTLRREKHMIASRKAGAEISRIDLKGRRAQYTYLAKVAAAVTEETAVLYRNNESMLPLVDLLDREGIPYRVRQANPTFFTSRVVLDITDILRFALSPTDVDLFRKLYYKLATYISRENAEALCALAQRRSLPVLEAAAHFSTLPKGTQKSCREVAEALAIAASSRPDAAIDLILRSCGYRDYLERMGFKNQKVFILKTLAAREDSIEAFLNRLASLRTLISEASPPPACPFLLSTIHASKGLEYDTVYLMDVEDGIFPESLPAKMKTGSKELAAYEEERRLFYVGVTRAKNKLYVFAFGQESTFTRELLSTDSRQKRGNKKAGSPAGSVLRSEPISEEAFLQFRDGLCEGLAVHHKNLGDGVIVRIDERRVAIQFAERERSFDLRFLFLRDLLKEQTD